MKPMGEETTTCTCWCERQIVSIPVKWIAAGLTRSCRSRECKPGCATGTHWDAFEVTVDAESPATGILKGWTPATDSSEGFRAGELARKHEDRVLIAWEPGLCYCGCANPLKNPRGRFLQGHDERMKGKLTRALRHDAKIGVVRPDGSAIEKIEVLAMARRCQGPKSTINWADKIVERARTGLREIEAA